MAFGVDSPGHITPTVARAEENPEGTRFAQAGGRGWVDPGGRT